MSKQSSIQTAPCSGEDLESLGHMTLGLLLWKNRSVLPGFLSIRNNNVSSSQPVLERDYLPLSLVVFKHLKSKKPPKLKLTLLWMLQKTFFFLVRCKWNAAETLLTGGRSRHTCVTESSSGCSGSHQRVELLLLWWMRQNVPAHVNVSELIGWTWTSEGSSGLQQFTVQLERRCSESSASPPSLTFKQNLALESSQCSYS